jgi:hypothetical protein
MVGGEDSVGGCHPLSEGSRALGSKQMEVMAASGVSEIKLGRSPAPWQVIGTKRRKVNDYKALLR